MVQLSIVFGTSTHRPYTTYIPGGSTWPQTSAFYPHKNRLLRDSGQLQDGLPLQVALYSIFNCSMFNCSVFNCSVFNCSVFNCSVFNYSVFNCSVFNYSVFNYTNSVQLRWLIVMGVYYVFEGFYCLNGAQLLPAAMHGPWVDVQWGTKSVASPPKTAPFIANTHNLFNLHLKNFQSISKCTEFNT